MAKPHNMKTWHVTVFEGYKTIFTKQCLNIDEANTLLKQKKEEYPDKKYSVVKENF